MLFRSGRRAAAPFLEQLAGLAHGAGLGAIARAPLEQALTVMRTLAAQGPVLTPPPPGTDATQTSQARDFSDVGVANQVLIDHGADLRYCVESRQWLVYKEGVWEWEPDDLAALDRVEATVIALVSQCPTGPKAEMLKSQQRLEAALRNLRHKGGVRISVNDLDSDPMLLNALNGTIDLRSGQLRPHDKRELHSKSVAAAYDPAAACPTWLSFLLVACGGDPELVAYLHRALGYSLTGLTTEQCFFFLYGGGQTGKSTLLEMLRRLLRGYADRKSVV